MWKIVCVFIIGFGVEKILGMATLNAEKMACYNYVLGLDITSREEESAVWENEITGTELTKCLLTELGVIDDNGINIRQLAKYQHLNLKCPVLMKAKLREVFDDCTRHIHNNESKDEEKNIDEVVECIYYTLQKEYTS